MMKCPHCGENNSDGTWSCSRCGEALAEPRAKPNFINKWARWERLNMKMGLITLAGFILLVILANLYSMIEDKIHVFVAILFLPLGLYAPACFVRDAIRSVGGKRKVKRAKRRPLFFWISLAILLAIVLGMLVDHA